VPAGVELAAALDGDVGRPPLQLHQLVQRLLDFLFLADDADEVVHRLLQLGVDRVRVLRLPARRGVEGARRPDGRGVHIGLGDLRQLVEGVDVLARAGPGTAAEHDQVGQRVAAEAVGAVHAARDLTGREQTRHDR
jgi:hypothetical protein